MSLFGRSRCTAPVAIAKPRWVICSLKNKRREPDDVWYMNAPPWSNELARHTTKAYAVAELRARVPRLEKGEVLLLWDDECEEWVEWEDAA